MLQRSDEQKMKLLMNHTERTILTHSPKHSAMRALSVPSMGSHSLATTG